VAVLDTGVDLSHPALEGRLVPGFDFVDMDSDPSETGEHGTNMAYGHGTHVAGLVALVAPEAKIMPVRVLDPDGVGNLWVLAEGLQYAFDPDGDPTTHDGADVINLSLGTRRQTGILAALVRRVACDAEQDGEYCRSPDRRAVIVAAAGNSGGSRLEYPAAEPVPGLLSVAATTQNDRLARFSTRASWVSVSAPGTDIVSSVPNGGYGSWSGTSMATPLVAGEAALIRSAYPRMSPRAVVSRIRGRARDIDGAPPRIDVAAALGIPRAP
jgi:subtilisin family serine protease